MRQSKASDHTRYNYDLSYHVLLMINYSTLRHHILLSAEKSTDSSEQANSRVKSSFFKTQNSSQDDQIFLHAFVAAANWSDWTQLKVRPSNATVDPLLLSVQRSPSCRQSASLKPDKIRGCVFVLATSQSCRKQTNSAEQNKRTFLFCLSAHWQASLLEQQKISQDALNFN